MVISKFNLTQYEDITYDTIKNGKVKTIEPEFVCSFNTVDEKGNKNTYTKNNAKFRKANLTKDERKVINRLREELGWNMNLLREIENPPVLMFLISKESVKLQMIIMKLKVFIKVKVAIVKGKNTKMF